MLLLSHMADRTPETRRAVFRRMTEAHGITDELGEAVWEPSIWKSVGGEEAFGIPERNEKRTAPATNTRKENAREIIRQRWGKTWQEEFDPTEKRFQQPALHALQGMATMAREGWSRQTVWVAMDIAFHARLRSGRSGACTFITLDVEVAKVWLAKVGAESKKRKEEVGLAEVMESLPEEVRTQQASHAAGGQGTGGGGGTGEGQ